MTSFDEVLRRRLRHGTGPAGVDPGQPFVTFYDDATGERTELSTTSWANWVAKTAGVLVEDGDLAAGDTVRLALPPTWLGSVFLGAAWLAGVEVVSAGPADLVVTGPEGDPDAGQVLACSLHPFALPFPAGGPPAGAQDFGTLWPNQPDSFLGVPGTAADAALDGVRQGDLLDRPGSPDRVLTDLAPTSPEGLDLLLDLLVGGGSGVWVARPAPERWGGRATSERVDREVRA